MTEQFLECMPVELEETPSRLSKADFLEVDYAVMGCAFAAHNELGCLLDESAYQNALRARCIERGIPTITEFKITLSHDSFKKTYFVDLICADGAVYELKAESALQPAHEAQLLNYLFLLDLNFGKLVNFRPGSVRSRIVSTSLNRADRQPETVDVDQYLATSDTSKKVPGIVRSILEDWGTHLDFRLYREALFYLLGNVNSTRIPILDQGKVIGSHDCRLLDSKTMIHITGFQRNRSTVRSHLQRLLKTTPLNAIQWINFAGHSVHLETVRSHS